MTTPPVKLRSRERRDNHAIPVVRTVLSSGRVAGSGHRFHIAAHECTRACAALRDRISCRARNRAACELRL